MVIDALFYLSFAAMTMKVVAALAGAAAGGVPSGTSASMSKMIGEEDMVLTFDGDGTPEPR